MTNTLRWFLVIFSGVCLSARPASAAGRGYTLIVAPARYSVMQVAFDVVQRDAAVLVSYQGEGTTAEPLLHAWNGKEWVHVSLQDFREVSFVERLPAQTILVGDARTLPSIIADSATWSPSVVRVTDLNTASLVNEFGRALKWNSAEWKWFAQRYNLKLNDESEPLRKSSWYDQPGPLYRPPLKDILFKRQKKTTEPPPAPVYPATGSDVSMPPVSGTSTWSSPDSVDADAL